MTRQRQPRASLAAGLPPRERVRQSGAVLISLIMLAASCWMLSNLVGQVLTSAQLDRQRDDLTAEIARIEARNTALAQEVAFAESPAYAEQVAREQLGMAREGDTVILPTFPETTPTSVAPTPAPLPSPTPQPNWQGWKQAILP